jgi:type IV pilus assembly protein PilB
MNKTDLIVSFLLEENILERQEIDDLQEECQEAGKSLLNMLRSKKILDQDQFTKLVAKNNSIEFVNLSPDMIDPVAVRLVSYEAAHLYNLIPVRIEKDTLYVAMSSPLNLTFRDAITTKTGYKVVPLAATTEAIGQAITYHYNLESITKQDIVEMRLKDSSEAGRKITRAKSQSAKVSDAPIVRLVDSILVGAINARASDIHIEPGEPDMRVRYRVDGILYEAIDIPSSAQREVISHIKILADMDISERRIPQDGHISVENNGKIYDLRASSLPAIGDEKIVLRILDTSTSFDTLDKMLGDSDDYKKVMELVSCPYGMILLTGPTGSGKTTTLYSMIEYLNTTERNIVTIEDPVEYRLKGITQVQVKTDIGRTFASGLRSILRQDPDVILIGEIRDFETAEIAVSAALTGHLVLSTLHTNDATGTISRLVRLGIPPFQVASSLLGAVAQRLVRVICAECREAYEPSKEELQILFGENIPDSKPKLYRGKGCNACHNTGYKGRQGVYEILENIGDVRKSVFDSGSEEKMKKFAITQGMRTLKVQGVQKVLDGFTTLEELLRVVDIRGE